MERQAAVRALSSLTYKQHAYLDWKLYGMTSREIAAMWGVTVQDVYNVGHAITIRFNTGDEKVTMRDIMGLYKEWTEEN